MNNVRNTIQTVATFILFGSLIPAILLKQFTVINPEYIDMWIFFAMIIALLLIIISFLFPKK
ncbi:hypothetical protein GZ22_10710 [Terribacillus saccharophilus]|uniref:Uncharacterized protein n=1 Tax=Terribacillus saccharophilus TaxID=361277 RepID=A0A075LRH4_9BACI|nr:hypothetical protein GZ22_10710 [Terribacillus goriensis]